MGSTRPLLFIVPRGLRESAEPVGLRDTIAAARRRPNCYRSTPIPEFHHRTAEHLVSTGKTDAVVLYLLLIESGSTG